MCPQNNCGITGVRGEMSNDKEVLSIGWALRDIVPDRPVLLRGMPTARVGKEVLDPITVTALALESKSGDKVIFVSADLGGIDEPTMALARENLKRSVPEFDPALLVVNATHTHTSLSGLSGIYPQPAEDCMTPEEAVAFMGKRIADVAAAAWKDRKPGAVAWGYGHAVVGHNRRVSYYSGETRMYGQTNDRDFSHIEGYEDHGVDLLFTFDEERKTTGVVVNLACPSQISAGLSSISADFWHDTRIAIRERLGQDLFVLPQCSAAGDQSPTLLLHAPAETRMLALREGVSPEKLDLNMAYRRELGRRIACAVEKVFPLASKDIRDHVPFFHRVAEWELPLRLISDADRAAGEIELAKAEKQLKEEDPVRDWTSYSKPFRQVYRYQKLLKRHEAQRKKKTFSTEAHIVRLGDIVFATNPFELFLDFGEQIKAESKAVQTFVVQIAGNGSYVPTERAVSGKGYGAEPVSNNVGPEAGRMIVGETLKIINELYGGNQDSELDNLGL